MNHALGNSAALCAALLLIAGAAAHAAVLTATNATLADQLKAAKPGDTVACPSCTGPIAVNNPVLPPLDFGGVTLDLTGARAAYVFGPRVSGLTVLSGDFTPAGSYHGCMDFSGSHITIIGATCHDGGITIQSGVGKPIITDISVQRVTVIGTPGAGVVLGGVSGFNIGWNTVTRSSGDGYDIAGSDHGVIHDNQESDNVLTPIHPDCVQFFNKGGPYPMGSSDIEVARNRCSGNSQGIDGFGMETVARIYVHDNEVVSNSGNGIGMYNCPDCRIENNHVSTYPGAPFQAVIMRPGTTGTNCGNRIEPSAGKGSVAQPACRRQAPAPPGP